MSVLLWATVGGALTAAVLAGHAGVTGEPGTTGGSGVADGDMGYTVLYGDILSDANGCKWEDGVVQQYSCGGQEVLYNTQHSLVEVKCNNDLHTMNCTLVPPSPLRRPGPLTRVEVTSCALPPSLPLTCATQGEKTEVLLVKFVRSSFTAENVRGLDAEEMSLYGAPDEDTFREVPVAAMLELPRLRRVILSQGSSLALHEDMFLTSSGLSDLTYLEISVSGVREIPPNAFRGLASLQTLNLLNNAIIRVAERAFHGLDSLVELVLDGNPLVSLPTCALPRTLSTLLLDRVALTQLQEGALQGLTQLHEVSITSSAQLSLGDRACGALPSLRSLRVSDSGVAALPSDLFEGSVALLNLTLTYNRISSLPRGVFSPLAALEKLDLSYNLVEAVSGESFLPLAALRYLFLEGNKIQSLPKAVFTLLTNLTTVSLAHNRLVSIDPGSFGGAASLLHLSLSHNNLSWAAADSKSSESPFLISKSLKTLDLSYNAISTVFDDWRFNLENLTQLNLSYNNITFLEPLDLKFEHATEVDFSNNHITGVQPMADGATDKNKSQLMFDGNPFRCDCHLYELLMQVKSGNKKYSVEGARCMSPASLARRPLREVDVRELTCAVAGVAAGCNCLRRPATNAAECTCDNTQVPSTKATGMPSMSLRLTRLPPSGDTLDLPGHVHALDLSGLGVARVPVLPSSVQSLDLTRNHIHTLPDYIWTRNLTIKLADNPLSCECSTTEQVRLLHKYNISKIPDYENVTCSDRSSIKQKDFNALCDVYWSAWTGTLAACGLILLAGLAALLYAYRIEIQVILYSRGWLLDLLPKEKIDLNKKYDVFVSFACEDEKFVAEEVLPRLSGYELHVQDRDWVAGNTIPAEIHRSVEDSRRTLIIVTPSFMRSMWAAEGFRSVHTQATNDRRLRAVVVLKDVKKNELDKETKLLLSLSTMLKYNESMFWGKVRYALPRKEMWDYRRVRDNEAPVEPTEYEPRKGACLDVILNDQGKIINKGYANVKDVA